METLYAYSGTDMKAVEESYGAVVRQEFYDGDLIINGSSKIDVTVRKALSHPISVAETSTSKLNLRFRRSWSHIRKNRVDLIVLWAVHRGMIRVARPNGDYDICRGQCGFTDARTAFHADIIPDDRGRFEAVHSIIPAHLLTTYIPWLPDPNTPFSISSGSGVVVDAMLKVFAQFGDRLSRAAAEPMVSSLLHTVGGMVAEVRDGAPARLKIADRRFSAIDAYVTRHLSNSDLSASAVAKSCGISVRYLSYLLKAHNTSYSELLWSKRLEKSREWLALPAMRDVPVCEIAYRAGYKSTAHFSRQFKAAFGTTPNSYRIAAHPHAT